MFIKPSHLYKIWGSVNPLSIALLPLSALYLLGHSINMLFRKSQTAPLPVICIGNITVGGTGKTPLALYIADMLADEGIKAHILMRGYGGSIKKSTMVNIGTHTAEEVGDEALMLAARHTVWIGVDRHKSAILAKAAGADVVIMDDGLQSRKLQRNLTLIVLDGAFCLGNRLPLPAGALREPWQSALKRADAVVVMGENNLAINRNCSGLLARMYIACLPHREHRGIKGGEWGGTRIRRKIPPLKRKAFLTPRTWLRRRLWQLVPKLPNASPRRGRWGKPRGSTYTCAASINLPAFWQARIVPMPPQHMLHGDGIYAFAGIGRPEKFFESLAQAGVKVVETKEFPDHHIYTGRQVEEMLQLCTRKSLSLVTTEKDFVKLPDSLKERIIAIPARVEFSAPEDFKQFILDNFKNPPRA